MRKMKKSLTFASIFVLSLTLLMIAMPYILNVAMKSSASETDPDKGKISYYKADLFDYESSKRSANGNFLLGETEINNDAALFLFNQENFYVNPASYGQTVVPRPGEHNSWISSYKYKVASGLVSNGLSDVGAIILANNRYAVSGTTRVNLFDETDCKTFKGSYSFPFENVGNGYLQYDSSKNHVEVTKEVGEDGLLKMNRVDGASQIGFMPFNKLNTSAGRDENGYYALSGGKNFYFGVKVDVPFVMPKGGKIATYTGEEQDMIFSFSGDDDMWVYIDDELVLDLGGIHDQVEGIINFATGVVTTTGNHFDETTGKFSTEVTTVSVPNTSIKSLSVGRHKLQVFYLERGGALSNCKITFRLQEDQTPEETKAPEEDVIGPATEEPSAVPTDQVSATPSVEVSQSPVEVPSEVPQVPTVEPTVIPTQVPTEEPIITPSKEPIVVPTKDTDEEALGKEPEEDKEVQKVTHAPEEDTNFSGNEEDKVAADDREEESEGIVDKVHKLFEPDVPKGFLPKTGTVSGMLFYVVGALLIVAGMVVLVIYVVKKRKNKK